MLSVSRQRLVLSSRSYATSIAINQVKVKSFLEHKSRIWRVEASSLITQGRRGSHYNLELKDPASGKQILERFGSGSSVNAGISRYSNISVDVTAQELSFLYTTDTEVVCMNPETYDESIFPINLLPANRIKLLNDGMLLTITSSESTPIMITTPLQAQYEVKETQEAMGSSGDNAGYKAALLDCGETIQVPEHIKAGERVVGM
jgi:translation elongation factor P/translation initiation factor 5A